MLRSNDTRRDTTGHPRTWALAATALLVTCSLSGCVRETVSCAENPSALCPDAGARMDTGPRADAFTPDVSGDAPGLDVNLPDVWEPDAWTPDDAWAPDAGFDGGPCSRCPTDRPACRMDSCVECTDDTHCAGHPSGPACDTTTNLCVGCVDPTLHCAPPLRACVSNTCVTCDGPEDCSIAAPVCASNSCVQCAIRSDCSAPTPACVSNACRQCDANTDCATASASRCDTSANTCGACMGDGDCSHIAGNPRCVGGTCRPCTVATEAMDCGANSCNPRTNACTMTGRGSLTQCLACVADSECQAGHTCAPVDPARGLTGTYCLPVFGGLCNRPYANNATVMTASGASAEVCRLATTTCEAMLMHRQQSTVGGRCTNDPPAGTEDAACGSTSAADGICRTSGGRNRCTYPCAGGSDDDCPAGFTCEADASVPVYGRRCAI